MLLPHDWMDAWDSALRWTERGRFGPPGPTTARRWSVPKCCRLVGVGTRPPPALVALRQGPQQLVHGCNSSRDGTGSRALSRPIQLWRGGNTQWCSHPPHHHHPPPPPPPPQPSLFVVIDAWGRAGHMPRFPSSLFLSSTPSINTRPIPTSIKPSITHAPPPSLHTTGNHAGLVARPPAPGGGHGLPGRVRGCRGQASRRRCCRRRRHTSNRQPKEAGGPRTRGRQGTGRPGLGRTRGANAALVCEEGKDGRFLGRHPSLPPSLPPFIPPTHSIPPTPGPVQLPRRPVRGEAKGGGLADPGQARHHHQHAL